ncbi:uncharacterized protein N7518_010477 [Penicillium psychrosexuale]|uniref:uncharacterized protein n=1 Tax=Penicillium psychrosexuale TaxID=1002107 RepID=UPI002545A3BC|nr:uncharacterized protein N7518_010477 [Penicillium psychrosexuale]KAJ5781994.1 hypothetical protein N7518_010477 [Penicillium psychrosexuale]
MSFLVDEGFDNLHPCTLNCFYTAVNESMCHASDWTCLCSDTKFFALTTDCSTTSSCSVKASLSATNITMTACRIPQDSQAGISSILAGVFGMLALIMVVLRITQRSVFNGLVGLDDFVIAAAMVCAAPLNCLMFPMQNLGLGTNTWAVPFEHITKELELLYIAEICYMAAEALTQLSFLTFYLRIFPSEKFQLIAYVLMGLSACFGISNTPVMTFQCLPIPYFWSGWTGEYQGMCININAYSWYEAAVQIAMDLAIIGLPIWPLLHTAMKWQKKLQVASMFCAGFLITVVSCLRLRSLVKFSKSPNTTYANTPAIYWSVVECDVAIICACMPAIPSLLRNISPFLFGQSPNYRDDTSPLRHTPQSIPLDHIQKDEKYRNLQATSSETYLV